MTAAKPMDFAAPGAAPPPCLDSIAGNCIIPVTDASEQWAGQKSVRFVRAGFQHFVIRAQHGQQHTHHLPVFQDGRRRATEPCKVGDERFIRGCVPVRGIRLLAVRRSVSGHNESIGLTPASGVQRQRPFLRHQGPQAVSENNQRPVTKGDNVLNDVFDDLLHANQPVFAKPFFPPR